MDAELNNYMLKVQAAGQISKPSTTNPAKRKNPLGPDGKVVKGRPRNEWKGGVSKPRAASKKTNEPKDFTAAGQEAQGGAATAVDMLVEVVRVQCSRRRGASGAGGGGA